LGDIRGHRQILRAAVVTVAIGGVLIAVAPSFGVLLVRRALQGPGGAFTPLAVGILREHADTRRLRQGTVAVVTGATAGVALGFLAAAQVFQATDSVRDVLWIPAVCMGCFAVLAGYADLATWHGALWAVVAANSVAGLGIGLVASTMTVVLTERSGPATTSVAIGMWITVPASGAAWLAQDSRYC
jgi:MFS family permease